ncbi:transposon Tf2-6 polyprotein [Trichonephila clavipes]|nr:transposon Tf2-6 polyprotein [Trichonephila clavipes]
MNATCAELVHGTTLRLPSDLFSTDKITTTCNQTYVLFLHEKMRALQPIPTSGHSNSSMFVPTNLKSCSHVFLIVDSIQPPLSQNYTGTHEVIRRTDKVFIILINGKRKTVSIDRVKPAYIWNDTVDIPLTGISKQQADETDPHSKDKTISHVNKTCDVPPLGSTSLEASASARGVGLTKELGSNIILI